MPRIVIDLGEELKSLGDAIVGCVDAIKASMELGLGGKAIDCAQIEGSIATAAARVEREGMRGILARLDVDAQQVSIGGKRYSRVGRSPGAYHTLAGTVSVERSLYREVGVRNGPTVDTIALRTGAVGRGWLPRTARAIAHMMALGTSRDAAKIIEETGRPAYSRSSFETVSHLVGEAYVGLHAEIEDLIIEEFEVPDDARTISASIDRVSIPIEEPRPRPVGRPRKGAPKKPCEVVYRMAYCATLTLHDDSGAAIHSFRYGRMPGGDPVAMVDILSADVRALLRKAPSLNVCLLADGAPEMWNLLRAELNEAKLDRRVFELIDMWHLLEKLAGAATVIHGEGLAAHTTLQRWKLRLMNTSTAALDILTELDGSGCEHVAVGKKSPVHEAMTYIENNHDRMNYADARRGHIPIGSGNMEATCKSLVTVRMKRSGSRWKNETGEHIIQLRALSLSDNWNDGMDLLFAALRQPVRRSVAA